MKKQLLKDFGRKVFAVSLALSMLASNITFASGWSFENNSWYVKGDNNSIKTGWYQDDKKDWYFLNDTNTADRGKLLIGWYQDNKKDWYFLNDTNTADRGKLLTGWYQDDKKDWYFLDTRHQGFFGKCILNKWEWIDGYCYLFSESGRMYKDTKTPDGYYVDKDGRWIENGKVVYKENTGILTKEISKSSVKIGTGVAGGGRNSKIYAGGGSGGGGSSNMNYERDKDNKTNIGAINVEYIDSDSGDILARRILEGKVGESKEIELLKIDGYELRLGQDASVIFKDKEYTVKVLYIKSELAGKIHIKYLNKDTNDILDEKIITGKIGDKYAIQYPAFQEAKLLENQVKEVEFAAGIKEIEITYRNREIKERQDQSLVIRDNVKALVANDEGEKEVLAEIKKEIFDYNTKEDGSLELSVKNDNPLLSYINNGVYMINDIVYIEPCDAFPVGLSFKYLGHDDNYSGDVSFYDSGECEVIRGEVVGLDDLISDGTYINTDDNVAEFESSKIWVPNYEAGEEISTFGIDFKESIELKNGIKIENKYSLEENGIFEQSLELSGKVGKLNLSDKISVKTKKPEIKIDLRKLAQGKDAQIKLLVDRTITNDILLKSEYSKSLDDLVGTLKKQFNNPENKIEASILGNKLFVEGVNFDNSIILGGIAYIYGLSGVKVSFNMSDVLGENKSLDIFKVSVSLMLTLDIEGKGNLDLEMNFKQGIDSKIGFEIEREGKVYKPHDLSSVKVTHSESLKFKVDGNVFCGIGLVGGPTVMGVMPVAIRAKVGPYFEGKASGEIGTQTDWKMKMEGEMEGGIKKYVSADFKLKIVVKRQDTVKDTLNLEQNLLKKDEREKLWSGKKDEVKEKSETGKKDEVKEKNETEKKDDSEVSYLEFSDLSRFRVCDSEGNDISALQKGYSPKTKDVGIYKNNKGKWVLEIPEYILEAKSENHEEYIKRPVKKVRIIGGREKVNIISFENNKLINAIVVESLHSLGGLNLKGANNLRKLKMGFYDGSDFDHYRDSDNILGLHTTDDIGDAMVAFGEFSEGLDLRDQINLEELELGGFDGIENLDLSNQIHLKKLSLRYFWKLKELNLNNQAHLEELRLYEYMEIGNLDLSDQSNLKVICLSGKYDNSTLKLNLNNKPYLEDLRLRGYIDVRGLDLSNQSNLKVLDLSGCGNIKKLDLNNKPYLKALGLNNISNIEELDLSNNSRLKQLALEQVGIKKLDLSNQSELKYLELSDLDIEELILSNNFHLENILLISAVKNLNIENLQTIKSLDINLSYDSIALGETIVDSYLETFTGNGESIPTGTWYAEEECINKVDKCAKGQKIYSEVYKNKHHKNRRILTFASPSDAEDLLYN